jgi:hypothetical protein
MSKNAHLLGVLQKIHDAIDSECIQLMVRKQMDTVVHTAPEIVDERWRPLYDLCRYHINDETNLSHKACFDIYHEGYTEYLKRFHR